MKFKIKYLHVFCLLIISLSVSCRYNENSNTRIETKNNPNIELKNKKSIPTGLQKLLKSYPDFLDSAGENILFFNDGSSMIYDDGIQKTHDEKLDNADLEDMMSQQYTKGADWGEPPAENFEPGRIRSEEFFKKMYGS